VTRAEYSGRPSTLMNEGTIEQVCAIIPNSRRVVIGAVAYLLQISHGSTCRSIVQHTHWTACGWWFGHTYPPVRWPLPQFYCNKL